MKKYKLEFYNPMKPISEELMLKFLRNHYKKVDLELSDDRLSGILGVNKPLKEITYDTLLISSNIKNIQKLD